MVRASADAGAAAFAVDELVHDPDRDQLRATGWFVGPDPLNRVAMIQVDGPNFSARAPIEVVRRPDVAQALGRNEVLESGWRFHLDVDDGAAPEGPLALRFLGADGGVLGKAAAVPLIRVARESGAPRHWAFALAISAMLVVGLFLRWFRAATPTRRPLGSAVASEQRQALLPAAIILTCAVVIGAIVPPFQSPDEFDHVERAYGLSKGHVQLATPEGSVSGVWVDDGLLAYMAKFSSLPFDADARLSREKALASLQIGWAGSQTFSGAPGTGYYLPIVYLPQVTALGIGEALGISVDASYRLARLASGSVAALLLFAAFLRWRPSVLVMALLLTPMTLFQWSGAGIDAVSIGAAALALALWLESTAVGFQPSARRIFAVSFLVVVVVGSRFHLAPLLILPLLMLRPLTFGRIAIALLPAAVIGAWVLFALASTQHPNTADMSAAERLLAYAAEPSRLVDVFWMTATTPAVTDFYGRSFVGVLGWLDTELPNAMYSAWGLLLGAAAVWTLAVADWRSVRWPNGLLLLIGAGSALLVPMLLLLMWTPFDASTIEGVQGRYFLLPALVLALAIPTARHDGSQRIDRLVGPAFVIFVALYVLVTILPLLVTRYYG